MKKPYSKLFILLYCSVPYVNAAVVASSNLNLNEQFNHSNQDNIISELEEACGTTYGAHEHDPQKQILSEYGETEQFESGGQKELHSYENYIFDCNRYFAQFK